MFPESGNEDEDDFDYELDAVHDFSDWSKKRIPFMEATTVEKLRKLNEEGD